MAKVCMGGLKLDVRDAGKASARGSLLSAPQQEGGRELKDRGTGSSGKQYRSLTVAASRLKPERH